MMPEMSPPAAQGSARAAGWIGIAAIVVLSLVPGDERPHSGLPGRIEHVIAYALVAAALAVGYRTWSTRLRFLAALALLACVLEAAQLGVPGRSSSIADAVAGSCGALIGMAAAGWATHGRGAH